MDNVEREEMIAWEYRISKIVMGQIHNEDETSEECGDLIGHDFNQPIPKQLYDMTKQELICVLKEIHNRRTFEEQFDYSNL